MSGSTSKSKQFQFPPTEGESELQNIILELARQQIGAVSAQREFQLRQLGAVAPIAEQLSAEQQAQADVFAPAQQGLAQTDLTALQDIQQAQNQLRGLELQRLTTGELTPEQEARITDAQRTSFEAGTFDIDRSLGLGLTQLREELAPSLGLRASDTPIQDRGGLLAREALNQRGRLASTLAANAAQQRLQLPFQASQASQAFQGSLQNFRSNLQQQGFENRLRLADLAGRQGIGLASIGGTGELAGALQSFKPQLQTISKAGGGGVCWCAAVYFGWFTPDWYAARNWIVSGWRGPLASLFRRIYIQHGERMAGWLRRSRVLRGAARPFFSWCAVRGK